MQCLFGVYIVYFQLFICLKCCFAKSSNFGQIRIKRALLYPLSYELVQGRFFKANTGPALLLASVALPLASVVLPLTGPAGNGTCPKALPAVVLFAGIGPLQRERLAGKELEGQDLASSRVPSHESTMVIKSLSNAITGWGWNRATRTKWDVSAHSHDGKVLEDRPCKCYCSVNTKRLRFRLRISSDFF